MVASPIKILSQCDWYSLLLSPLHGSLWRNTLLFVAALWVLEPNADVPHESSLLAWDLGPSVFPHRSGSPGSALGLFFGHSPVCLHFSSVVITRIKHSTPDEAWQDLSGKTTTLTLLVASLWMQPWRWFFDLTHQFSPPKIQQITLNFFSFSNDRKQI